MNKTAIAWTEKTWNPTTGCRKVSPGCAYCYACAIAEQKRGTPAFPIGFDLQLRRHKLTEPTKIKTPSLIFVNSMSDLFWEDIPDDYRDQVFDTIESTPRHTYQILTKRPENMLRYSRRRALPDNVWVGVTVESQPYIDRVDVLRQVRAAVRFVSLEPLLSPINMDFAGLDWCIVGGESGLHLRDPQVARKRSLAEQVNGKWQPRRDRESWVRDIKDACELNSVAFFFKQWGGARPTSAGCLLDGREWKAYPMVNCAHQ
ncbi:MAG TPA: phage Gp37/Gp68 family protein [Phycisphaerae bacterium]|nr:phage Gp37/Gp68 family protein [Phycisphaerae bacterium]